MRDRDRETERLRETGNAVCTQRARQKQWKDRERERERKREPGGESHAMPCCAAMPLGQYIRLISLCNLPNFLNSLHAIFLKDKMAT